MKQRKGNEGRRERRGQMRHTTFLREAGEQEHMIDDVSPCGKDYLSGGRREVMTPKK